MAHRLLGSLVSYLRDLTHDGPDATDGHLLERFSTGREPAAFDALVRRHGPMVWGLCRRVLRDDQDAEDAFQATFLILARRAAALDRRRPLGSWLYTVAYHVGLRARVSAARRRAAEETYEPAHPATPGPMTDLEHREELHLLDEELHRLPGKYRAPLVLCYLEGRTHADAARELGLPRGSLAKRLAVAEGRLRHRLVGRGLAFAVGGGVAIQAAVQPQAVTAALLEQTVRAAVHFREGGVGAGTVSSAVADLAGGGLRIMIAGKRLWVIGIVAVLALMGPVLLWSRLVKATPPPAVAAEDDRIKADAPAVKADPENSGKEEEAGWSTLRGRIVFGGPKAPAPVALNAGAKAAGCPPPGVQLFSEEWVVHPENKGVRWAFVWLAPEPGSGKKLPIHESLRAAPRNGMEIDQPCCQFVPHALALREGQDLIVKNSSAIPHNANLTVDVRKNSGQNILVPAGTQQTIKGLKVQGLPITIDCNIHPWMKARVAVFDHPYFAVTDADGRFEIPNAPAGTWRLRVWHDTGWRGGAEGRDGEKITVENGKPTKLDDLPLGP